MDDDSSSDLSSLLSSECPSDLSSDLSSTRSPSPFNYPSPPCSQGNEFNDTSSQMETMKRTLDEGDAPPPRKRRKVQPKPRTTQHLDLTGLSSPVTEDQKAQLDTLLKVLRKRKKIVVIAGAGISVSAGIPDFRSSTGLFKTLRNEHKLKASGKQLFDASVYQTDSSTSSFHDMVRSLSHLVSEAKPTAFHKMLSTLGTEGRLLRLYTQNVDGIDVALPSLETNVPLSAKGPWARSVQLHGGLEKMVCSKCSHLSDFEPALFEGPEPPLCCVCIETDKVRTDHAGKRSHGIGRLRPRIVLYNEHNPDEEAIGAVMGSDLRSRPDAVIVVGTSMKIPGVRRIVREMCGVVRGRRDGLSVWINQDGPPPGKEFEDCWDLVVKGPCDEVARRWSEAGTEYANCTESEVERAKQRTGDVKVMVGSQQDRLAIMPTPAASPRIPPSEKPKLSKIKIPITTALRAEMVKQQLGSKESKPGREVGMAKKPRGRPPTKPQQKLDFKVTKSVSTKLGRPKKTKAAENHASRPAPMEPLSPSAARNNGPIWTPSTPLSTHSQKTITFDTTNPEDDGKWGRGRETISPTGSVPKDMLRLLDG